MSPTTALAVVPGFTELLVIALILVLPVGIAYWTYRDARKRNNPHAASWAISMLLWGLLGLFPIFVGLGLYTTVREPIAD
ncbi:MAG: hypothetical protein ABEH35_03390 [Haloarculaceae archaeon]